jgi:tetratricopeptide (TPR) repeat protein
MKTHTRILMASVLSLAVGTLSACQSGGPRGSGGEPSARLFSGMGPHTRAVTTTSSRAQEYFDQGLTWMYAFNHDEAIRSFTEAGRLDPACAMAWWGVALCHGPHINNPVVPDERRAAAWEAVQRALSLQEGASPAEQALIHALAARYSADVKADRAPLDKAYAEAMVAVQRAHPNDADIAVLTAEALMDLQPWDLWTPEGAPKGRTREIVGLLEQAIARDGDHPGALHLYIHAVEASKQPERAVGAADRLRNLVPAAGHLVHMPAHIDVRVGRWDQASDANVRAAKADAAYRRIVPKHGFYHVYMAHNHHFLAWSAMMEGRSAVALRAARDMIAGVPAEFFETSAALIDPYMAIEDQVLMRFGLWDEVLALPEPRAGLPITAAHRKFARGCALAAKGDVAGAEREQAAFRAAKAAVPADAMMAINKAQDVLTIADFVLAGEIAFRRGNIRAAEGALRNAAMREDRLLYMEPPEWVQPARHSLGAMLLSAGRPAEAERVYREDLARWPENAWALFGLSRALEAQGKPTGEVDARFKAAWKRADIDIHASCLCIPKSAPTR